MNNPPVRKIAVWLLAGCGVFQTGMGIYFVRLRPTLLPEDEGFIGHSLESLSKFAPPISIWLDRVFTVLGGHILATGLLIILTALLLWFHAGNRKSASALVFIAGLSSVVLMSAVNFAIHSDFRWLLLLPAAAWMAAVMLLVVDLRNAKTD
jgi:hypothetical protein